MISPAYKFGRFFNPVVGATPNDVPNLQNWYQSVSSIGGSNYANGAANFLSASSQSLSVASNSSLQTGNVDWFISIWYNNPISVTGSMFSKDSGGAGNREYNALLQGGVPRLNINDASAASKSAVWGSSTSTNTWHHYFAWYDSVAQTVNISIDLGAAVSTSTAGFTPTTTTTTFRIGNDGFSEFFNGQLDAEIFGKNIVGGFAITPALTIQTVLYNSGNGLAAKDITSANRTSWGVISGWDFDGPGANIVKDYIGTNTLTNNNVVTQVSPGIVSSPTIATGDTSLTGGGNATNGAANFVGSSSQTLSSVGIGIPFNTNATLACWINPAVLSAGGCIFDSQRRLGVGATTFQFRNGAGGFDTNFGPTIRAGLWYFVCIVRSGTVISMSVDAGSTTNSLNTSPSAGTQSFIVGQGIVGFLTGQMDSLVVWNSALTAAQITTLYNGGVGIACKDLAANGLPTPVSGYDFDGPGSQLVKDYIGTNTLTNNNVVTYTNGIVQSRTITDGDAVARLADQKLTGNDLLQYGSGFRPIYKTNIQNGNDVHRYTAGSSQFMTAEYVLNQPCTVVAVVKSSTASGTIFDGGSGGATAKLLQSGSDWQANAGTLLDSTIASDSGWHFFALVLNGGVSQLTVDGTVGAQGNAGTNNPAGFTLASVLGGGSYDTLDFGEVGIYPRVLLNSEISQLRTSWAQTKWATP